MEKIELEIIALSHSVTQSHSYAVVLGEKGGNRRLPVVIGGFEAQAIAVALEEMKPSRPLTHDLMKNIFEHFDVQLKHVVINNLVDGIFYAQLVCEHNGEEITIDSRTSDALALGVRFKCTFYTYEFILDSAGITVEETEEMSEAEKEIKKSIEVMEKTIEENIDTEDLTEYDSDDLDRLLKSALEKEDYERAARIRDEINRREQS